MTFGEFEVLTFLARDLCDTATDLARAQGYSRSLISKMVDKLIKQGYLTAQQDREDRRVIHLKLTPSAEVAIGEVRAVGAKVDKRLEEIITPEEMEVMEEVLKRIQICFETQQIQEPEVNE